LAHHEDAQGNWDDAMKYYSQSKERYWQTGNMRKWGDPMCMIIVLYHKKGEFKQSLKLAERVLQVGEESGDAQLRGWGLQSQGSNFLRLGLLDEAADCLQKAIDLLWDIPDYLVAGLAKKDLGRCYLQQGDIDRGTELVEESCRILAEHGVHSHFDADFYNAMAEAYLKKAEVIGNNSPDILKKAKSALRRSQKYSRRFKGRIPVALRLAGSYKFLRGNVAAAKKCWQESLEAAEKLGALYEIGATCLEFGRKCEDLNYIERAREIFQKTGAVIDLKAAEEEYQVVAAKVTQ
jgi:tetratricopeptide (TPR) repeat protein